MSVCACVLHQVNGLFQSNHKLESKAKNLIELLLLKCLFCCCLLDRHFVVFTFAFFFKLDYRYYNSFILSSAFQETLWFFAKLSKNNSTDMNELFDVYPFPCAKQIYALKNLTSNSNEFRCARLFAWSFHLQNVSKIHIFRAHVSCLLYLNLQNEFIYFADGWNWNE